MKEDKNNVEIFTEDSIITLYDDQDQPIEFFEIASVEYEEKFYELLQPVELIEGIGEDEAVVFEYTVSDDESEKFFKPIEDEAIMEAVFDLYIESAADFESCEPTECDCCSHGDECSSKK